MTHLNHNCPLTFNSSPLTFYITSVNRHPSTNSMLLYFDFEDRRLKAEVKWPSQKEPIEIHLTDPRLLKHFPPDLYFEVDRKNKVVFTIESRDNKRLIELQNVLGKRLQEFVNKS